MSTPHYFARHDCPGPAESLDAVQDWISRDRGGLFRGRMTRDLIECRPRKKSTAMPLPERVAMDRPATHLTVTQAAIRDYKRSAWDRPLKKGA